MYLICKETVNGTEINLMVGVTMEAMIWALRVEREYMHDSTLLGGMADTARPVLANIIEDIYRWGWGVRPMKRRIVVGFRRCWCAPPRA